MMSVQNCKWTLIESQLCAKYFPTHQQTLSLYQTFLWLPITQNTALVLSIIAKGARDFGLCPKAQDAAFTSSFCPPGSLFWPGSPPRPGWAGALPPQSSSTWACSHCSAFHIPSPGSVYFWLFLRFWTPSRQRDCIVPGERVGAQPVFLDRILTTIPPSVQSYLHLTSEEIDGTENCFSYCSRYMLLGMCVAGVFGFQSLCAWSTGLHQRGWAYCCERGDNHRFVTPQGFLTLLLRT